MGHFFSFIRHVRNNKDQLSSHSMSALNSVIEFVRTTLGLISEDVSGVLERLKNLEQDVSDLSVEPSWIESLIEERKLAKLQKNWARADEIRKELTSKKVVLKDHPDGSTTWSVQSN
jgi:cysteinyl-tRNA synthetase